MKSFKFAMLALFAVAGVCAFTQRCDAGVNALQLAGDPNSYFEVADSPSLAQNLASAFTIEAWVKPSGILTYPGADGQGYIILNKEDSYELGVNPGTTDNTSGTLQVAVFPSGGAWEWHDSGGAVPGLAWTHVAATWDGLKIRLFANGKFLLADDKTGTGLNFTASTLKVGRRERGSATLHQCFAGLITEVRISRVVRYTEAGYTVPTTQFTPDANTVALYHFDSAVNGVVRDASPFGNNGQLIQDAVLVPAIGIPLTFRPAARF